MKRKGMASYIEPLFALLFTGLIAVTLAIVLPSDVVKVTPVIEEKEFENKAIILGNSLMSNPALAYADGDVTYRGKFDSAKLDSNLFKLAELKVDNLAVCKVDVATGGGICKYASSPPESFAFIAVSDIKNGNGWFSVLYPPLDYLTPDQQIQLLGNITSCLMNFNQNDIPKIFDKGLQTLAFEECGYEAATILDGAFPVNIRYSDDETNMGMLRVVVVE
ncbi:MAG: hypothetical protein HYT70_00580 [Candidatus Aenigmarchaeota archaeon]|nr:hypothetical protein [Candidatus Aenigmarchaeota archaeon]